MWGGVGKVEAIHSQCRPIAQIRNGRGVADRQVDAMHSQSIAQVQDGKGGRGIQTYSD